MGAVGEITGLLDQLADAGGDSDEILGKLMPLVYGELKIVARANRYRWSAQPRHGTTSLVHEAFVKLAGQDRDQPAGRGQFFALASRVMRSILVDNARWHSRKKRGGGAGTISTDELQLVSADRCDELLALDEVLQRLETSQPELSRVVECRIFGGLTVVETAEALDISAATVKRRWSLARAWLYRALDDFRR